MAPLRSRWQSDGTGASSMINDQELLEVATRASDDLPDGFEADIEPDESGRWDWRVTVSRQDGESLTEFVCGSRSTAENYAFAMVNQAQGRRY